MWITQLRSPFESITYLQQSLERRTYKLQKRIYQASSRGDVKAIRRLQKTLMNSWSAKCIAVRRVTQDNNGKNTAGVVAIAILPLQPRYRK
ncbi:reverse transcriptase N-terminal domain-containing protein, partial [Fischerella thermalis]|uniref:reverse transcriptase N-terminal domain-containing protein n=3 Tax=Fischerella thermalis TaxID=372787 RepID=UPI00030069FB